MQEAQHSQAAAEASLAEAALQQRHAEELTAARAEAAQGLEAAAATVAAWQQRCQQAEATRGQTAGALRSALAEAEELRAAVQDLRRQVAEVGAGAQRRDSESQGLGRRIVQLEAELEARGAAHAAELRRLRERHAAELSAIQGRLAQVRGEAGRPAVTERGAVEAPAGLPEGCEAAGCKQLVSKSWSHLLQAVRALHVPSAAGGGLQGRRDCRAAAAAGGS